jgi:hypothetical protein
MVYFSGLSGRKIARKVASFSPYFRLLGQARPAWFLKSQFFGEKTDC